MSVAAIKTIASSEGLGMFNNLFYPGKDSVTIKRMPITHDNRYIGKHYRRAESYEILVNATRVKTDALVAAIKTATTLARKPHVSVSEIKALDSETDPRVISRVVIEINDISD